DFTEGFLPFDPIRAIREIRGQICFRQFPPLCYVLFVTFAEEFKKLHVNAWMARTLDAPAAAVRQCLDRSAPSLDDFACLISPAAAAHLETLCARSHTLTLQRFGRVMRLFAPLYLSNECINNCKYCGFSRDNPILRVTLSVAEVQREARALTEQGFRNLLLVSGEHPKFVSSGYLQECVQ